MKKILSALAVTLTLAVAPAIAADAPAAAKPVAAKPTPAVQPNPNSPEMVAARKKAFLEQEKQWNSLTKEQKLDQVNKQHEAMLKNINESWSKLDDAGKIAQQQANLDRQKKFLGL